MTDQEQLSDEAKLNNRLRAAYLEGMGVGYKAGKEPRWIPPECPYPLTIFKTRAVGRTRGLLECEHGVASAVACDTCGENSVQRLSAYFVALNSEAKP